MKYNNIVHELGNAIDSENDNIHKFTCSKPFIVKQNIKMMRTTF
jgi:hypothetical protein